MTRVKSIVGDLVERRLWPVAVLLVAALVAVPVVLGRGGESVEPPAALPATDVVPRGSDTASKSLVALDQSAPALRNRAGVTRNPFKRPASAAKKSASESTPTASAPTPVVVPAAAGPSLADVSVDTGGGTSVAIPSVGGSGGSGSTRSDTTRSDTTGADTTGSDPSGSDDAAAGKPTYRVSLRFGPTVGERETLRDVARLTVLPDADHAVVGLLGVLADGKTASFVPAPNVTASGEGTCKPSRKDCKTVDLRAGDAEYLRVTSADGQPDSWYYLELLRVDRAQASSARQASAAYARRSGAGAAVIRKAAASVRHVRYLPARGVLVRAKRSAKGQAAARVARGLVPLLPAPEQPGIAVWRSRKPAPSSP